MAGIRTQSVMHQLYFKAITKFEFLIGFVVAWKCLTLVKPLSVSLQLSSIDICKAYKYVSK